MSGFVRDIAQQRWTFLPFMVYNIRIAFLINRLRFSQFCQYRIFFLPQGV